MQVEQPAAPSLTDAAPARDEVAPAAVAIGVFAALSLYCGIRSQGFISADACMHFLSASYAFSNPKNFVDVWNRPVVTMLYAGPAWIGGRAAVRVVCMLVAIACGWVGWRIAAGQGARWPVLALFFTLGQPLLFLHSFGEMTELPFALLIGLAFMAWQKERFWLAASLAAWAPLARPEGFGIVLLLFPALLLQRRWRQALVLPIPILLWDIAGWMLTGRGGPWWHWLQSAWPYAGQSLYGRGSLFTFIALLPAVVSPIVLPAMWIGMWRSLEQLSGWSRVGGRVSPPAVLREARRARTPALHERQTILINALVGSQRGANPNWVGQTFLSAVEPGASFHLRLCRFLTAALPLFVLIAHSLLYWLGKMASYGEVRYLLVVAPFWGVLSARGWEWAFTRLHWRHPLRWAAAAVLLPIVANAFVPVVPVPLAHDWQSARSIVQWYQSDPIHVSHPKIMAAHPGIPYFLGINPYASPRVRGWDKPTLASHAADTLLIWDPVFSTRNASANLVLELDEIHRAGWKEIEAPRLFENDPDVLRGAQADPKDPRNYWHVFVSGE